MARHPGTEGNELHPSDVIIPDPSGGDGRLSVRNDLAAEFAGLAISSTQPSDMPNGGVWVNLSADPTGIDRLQTYDESTDAFIPISADSTVVSEEEPEPEIGLLWFEPVDDGANLYAANSESWEFLQFIPAIPDNLILRYPYQERTDTEIVETQAESDENGQSEGTDNISDSRFVEGHAEQSDGSAHIVLSTALNFGSEIPNGVGIGLTVDGFNNSDGLNTFVGVRDDNGVEFSVESTDGNPRLRIRSNDGDTVAVKAGDFDISDGEKTRLFVRTVNGSSSDDMEIYADGDKLDVSEVLDQGASDNSFDDFVNPFHSHARNEQGSTSNESECVIDAPHFWINPSDDDIETDLDLS